MSNTNLATHPVHCVFYSHVWAIHMLKQAGFSSFKQNVIVELANISNLAPIFGLQAKARYGLAGLLRLGTRLEQLSQTLKYVPAPIVLAPNPQVSTAALNSAACMLPHSKSQHDAIILMIHMNDASDFLDVYPHVDSFRILWDIADQPSAGLNQLAELLADNRCISTDNWQGFKLYQHPNRQIPDAQERQAALETMLADYPQLSP